MVRSNQPTDGGRSPTGRATLASHQAPTGLGHAEGIPNADCPPKAFAVLEEDENTGGIVYAKSAVAARRLGADEYADGDFSAVSCRRAPWADDYHDKPLPVSIMVEAGWHFECGGCGCRIDEDYLYDTGRMPEDVVGVQHSAVYCDAVCEATYALHRAKCKRLETRWLRRFAKIVKARFPDAKPKHAHAYARSRADGRLQIAQVSVEFDFPGRKYAMAQLAWREKTCWEKTYPKPAFTCSAGDKGAFEKYAAQVDGNPKGGDAKQAPGDSLTARSRSDAPNP